MGLSAEKQGREGLTVIIQHQIRLSFTLSFREKQGLMMMVRSAREVVWVRMERERSRTVLREIWEVKSSKEPPRPWGLAWNNIAWVFVEATTIVIHCWLTNHPKFSDLSQWLLLCLLSLGHIFWHSMPWSFSAPCGMDGSLGYSAGAWGDMEGPKRLHSHVSPLAGTVVNLTHLCEPLHVLLGPFTRTRHQIIQTHNPVAWERK